ncbi:MAG: hypothetical protein RLZZ04_358 [Cyanobacteriota bacterium]
MANNKNSFENLLLVEGATEKRAIPELIEANGIIWERSSKTPIVFIDDYAGGDTKVVKPAVISNELNVANRKALGLIVDADHNCANRWQSVRNACLNFIPDLPQDIPPKGLIHDTLKKNGKPVKFGLWIMPDNQTGGMLETFLAYLVKDESEALWQYSQEVVLEAKNKGANYKPTHVDKANIHTWLAWQDEPGNQLHIAVKKKILDPQHPKAKNFIDWFTKLYDLKIDQTVFIED